MVEKVKKRNGRIQKFDTKRLLKSIHVSLHKTGLDNVKLEERIADGVVKHIGHRKVADTEDIRSAVCYVLKKNKHHEACDFYSLVWLHAKPVKVKYVMKRHGRKEKFSPEKLFKSVQKSFNAAGVKDGKALQDSMQEILRILGKRYKGKYATSDEIKDIVEYALVKRNLNSAAKNYIMYRYM